MTAAQPDPTSAGRAPISGIIALAVGIAAFVFCWVPFLGLGLGAGSIVLGILAVRGGRSRGAGIGGLAFGAVAAIPAVVMTIAFIAAFVIALPTGSGSGGTAGPSTTSSPTPSASPSPRTGAEEKAQYEARLKEKQEAERAAREEDVRKNGVELPDLAGLDGKTAQWRLEDLGLTAQFDGKSGTVLAPANWTVIGSSPGPGKRAKLGSTVVLRMEKTAERAPAPAGE